MKPAITEPIKEEQPKSNSVWLIRHLHESLIRSILDTLLNFKTKNKELQSSLFQLHLILSSLPHKALSSSLFKDIARTLSKTMVTYRDHDEIVKKIIESAKALRHPVDFLSGLQVLLFLCRQDHNQGAIASLEAVSFLLYFFITTENSSTNYDAFKSLSLLCSCFLDIKDGLASNVNVGMFIHDSLLELTRKPFSDSQEEMTLEGRSEANQQTETNSSRNSSNWWSSSSGQSRRCKTAVRKFRNSSNSWALSLVSKLRT